MRKLINLPAQFIMDNIVSSDQNNLLIRIKYFLFTKIRDIITYYYDPLIEFGPSNQKLLLPFSHDLPIYLSKYENYTKNIHELTLFLSEKLENFKIINVGANIGDTAYFIRKNSTTPILALEPEPQFYEILKVNAERLKDVECINSLLGNKNGNINLNLKISRGNAYLKQDNKNNQKLKLNKLDTLLIKNKYFADSKLLITDTDGYDYFVLMGARSFLKKIKPVIFFEYNPILLNALKNSSGIKLIQYLSELGYKDLIFYDNFGRFITSTDIKNTELINDLSNYIINNKQIYFYDVCAFHKNDNLIYKQFLQQKYSS